MTADLQKRSLYTIGHSNQPIDQFVSALQSFGAGYLVDVRAWPESRRFPHFGRNLLQERIERNGIGYFWEGAGLGGHRKSSASAGRHIAIDGELFRNYAAHMETVEFVEAIGRVCKLAGQNRTVIMCAERNPVDCHRSFIADYLVSDGWEVRHITGPAESCIHDLNESARREDKKLIYDRVRQYRLEGF